MSGREQRGCRDPWRDYAGLGRDWTNGGSRPGQDKDSRGYNVVEDLYRARSSTSLPELASALLSSSRHNIRSRTCTPSAQTRPPALNSISRSARTAQRQPILCVTPADHIASRGTSDLLQTHTHPFPRGAKASARTRTSFFICIASDYMPVPERNKYCGTLCGSGLSCTDVIESRVAHSRTMESHVWGGRRSCYKVWSGPLGRGGSVRSRRG